MQLVFMGCDDTMDGTGVLKVPLPKPQFKADEHPSRARVCLRFLSAWGMLGLLSLTIKDFDTPYFDTPYVKSTEVDLTYGAL